MGCAGLVRKRRLPIPPFAAPPSSGGGFTPAGATITLSANATLSFSGAAVPFDTVNQDPHGYFNSGGNNLKVPAGLAGLYLYGFNIGVNNNASLTGVTIQGVCSGSADNIFYGQGTAGGTTNIIGTGTGLERFAVGDTFGSSVVFSGVASIHVIGGGNGSQIWLLRVTA